MFVKSLGFCVLCTWPLRPLARNVFPSFPGPFWLCAGFFNRNGAQHSSGKKNLGCPSGKFWRSTQFYFSKKNRASVSSTRYTLCLAQLRRRWACISFCLLRFSLSAYLGSAFLLTELRLLIRLRKIFPFLACPEMFWVSRLDRPAFFSHSRCSAHQPDYCKQRMSGPQTQRTSFSLSWMSF